MVTTTATISIPTADPITTASDSHTDDFEFLLRFEILPHNHTYSSSSHPKTRYAWERIFRMKHIQAPPTSVVTDSSSPHYHDHEQYSLAEAQQKEVGHINVADSSCACVSTSITDTEAASFQLNMDNNTDDSEQLIDTHLQICNKDEADDNTSVILAASSDVTSDAFASQNSEIIAIAIDTDHHHDNMEQNVVHVDDDQSVVSPLITSTLISKEILSSIVKDRNFRILRELGGLEGVAAKLDTNLDHGICISTEDIPTKYFRSFFNIVSKPTLVNWNIFLLFCEDPGLNNLGWFDGTAIFVAIFLLVAIPAYRNYKAFRKSQNILNYIEVLRCDVVFLKTEDWVPADGLFIDGEKLKVDDDDSRYRDRVENPFLCYGAKVIEDLMMMSTTTNDCDLKEQSPFLVALLMKLFLRKRNGKVGSSNQINKKSEIQDLTRSVEKLLSNEEGLPFGFSLFFFFWNEKMKKKYQVLIRRPCLGVKMGSVTTLICTIEGLITSNQMEVSTFVTSKDVLEAIHDGIVSTLPQVHKDNDAEETIHLHWKGTAETILAMCSTCYDNGGIVHPMDDEKRAAFTQRIQSLDSKGLEPIAFACRQIEIDGNDDELVDYNGFLYEDGLTWVGLLGLKYPHFSIKLVSSRRLSVLKTIAMESGILPLLWEASLASDKLLFVQCLKRKGEIVAVTGTTLSDSPSLKAADVGILMGKRISTRNGEREFSLVINLVTTISTGDSPFPSLHLAAFAMLTIPPKNPPYLKTYVEEHTCSCLLSSSGFAKFSVHQDRVIDSVKSATVFNGFVLYNILNQFNVRDIEKKNVFKGLSCIFEGKTYRFLVAVGVPIFLLVVVMEFAAKYTDVAKLTLFQWVICFVFAFTSIA
ncbi:hypothetical protein MKW92_029720 [Papaver armeniacum]|nr:hypothetical protein MKW92_029720 [Papaver armeniacum]